MTETEQALNHLQVGSSDGEIQHADKSNSMEELIQPSSKDSGLNPAQGRKAKEDKVGEVVIARDGDSEEAARTKKKRMIKRPQLTSDAEYDPEDDHLGRRSKKGTTPGKRKRV